MPRTQRPKHSIQADVLEALKLKGVESTLLDCRLSFMDLEGTRRYVAAMEGQERVFPTMLPTQASGRWSTKEPPLVNFPKAIRDVVVPDPDEWVLSFDWDSAEARLFMGYAGDEEDLAAIARGEDIHAQTAQRIFGQAHGPYRQAAKNLRFAVLQYGTNEKAANGIRDIEKLGMTREQFYAKARQLLHEKPKYMAWKLKAWGEAIEEGMSRTFLGRKRRLFPTWKEKQQWHERKAPGDAAKEGLNHRIQGAIADMMNDTLIQICLHLYPGQARLFVNRHDGAELGFPMTLNPKEVVAKVTPVIARYWDVGGCLVPITAEGEVWREGKRESVRFECPEVAEIGL